MKVLITGGGGFIGSHLADRLLADGHEVLVIDNYSTGRRDNLTDHEALTVVEATIADPAAVDQAFSGSALTRGSRGRVLQGSRRLGSRTSPPTSWVLRTSSRRRLRRARSG